MAMNSKITVTGLEEAKALFGEKLMRDTIRSTVNKVARQSRTQLSRDVREIYNVKAGAVKKGTSVEPARGKGTEAFIFSTGKRIPLREFGARQTARGVTVNVRRSTGRKRLPGHFIVESIGQHVFRRHGEKRLVKRGRYAGTQIERQPIVKALSLSIAQMIRSSEAEEKVIAFSQEISPRVFEQELNFRIRRAVQKSARAAAQTAIRR